MRILWLNWKDRSHPQSGGAEVVNEQLAKRLAADGHEVLFLVGAFPGCPAQEKRDGFSIIRMGGRFGVYWKAYRYYKKNLQTWPDLVIDEMNTAPFFAKFYAKQKSLLFVHQLCREIWFYQMPFPLDIIGYLLEPIWLWLLNDREVITVSESTKKDLLRFGFRSERIHIISEGIELEPLANLDAVRKFEAPTILAFGAIRPMKRTADIVRAFELAKETLRDIRLVIAGGVEGNYGKQVLEMIRKSKYATDIEYLGKVSQEKKIELMQKSHLIAVTSVKEGWGLVVTEANSQGTPAVVYDVDGLRDSVRNGATGWITQESKPQKLAEKIVEILGDILRYETIRKNAWEWSKEITFEKSNRQLVEILKYV